MIHDFPIGTEGAKFPTPRMIFARYLRIHPPLAREQPANASWPA